MLYRKIGNYIEEHFKANSDKILILEGVRQIGKSYIIREVGKRLFKNFVEINFVNDEEGKQTFKNIKTTEEFEYLISSGITLDVHAIANPKYPLKESAQKNLLKLYLNDVGMLTSQIFHNNLRHILQEERSINLGAAVRLLHRVGRHFLLARL